MNGIELIAAERKRQIEQEGWTPEHDDEHVDESLASVAALYATPPVDRGHHLSDDLCCCGHPSKDHTILDGFDGCCTAACCDCDGFKGLLLEDGPPCEWPLSWDVSWWKPTPRDRVRELVKAGALIAAEIDRLQRASQPAAERQEEQA